MVLYTLEQLETYTITDLKKIGSAIKVPGRSKWNQDRKNEAITAILNHQNIHGDAPEVQNTRAVQRNTRSIDISTITPNEIRQMNISSLKKLVKSTNKINISVTDLKKYKKNNKVDLAEIIINQLNVSTLSKVEILQQRVKDLFNELQSFNVQEQRQILEPYFMLYEEQKEYPPPIQPPTPSPIHLSNHPLPHLSNHPLPHLSNHLLGFRFLIIQEVIL
jgi:hypothetical protein